jgi:hypothetical protein
MGTKEMKVTDLGNAIEISGQLDDLEIVAAIQNTSPGQSLEESLLEILILGSKVKEAVQTTSTAQVIEKSIQKVSSEFEKLEDEHELFIQNLMARILSMDPKDEALSLALKMNSIEEQLKSTFTNEADSESVISMVKKSVEGYLQQRESSITKLLSLVPPDLEDPNAQESPLLRLYNHVGEVLELMGANKAAKEAAKKTSKKGTVFEDLVFAEMQNIADSFGDEADDPGKQKKNGVDGNDEGDITVDFKSLGRYSGRLVIECKKYLSKKSKRSLLTELDKGISNRLADYGIMVTTESSYELADNHPFWEDFDNRRAVVVLQNENDEIDFNRLRFAFLMAKARIKEIKNHGDEASFQLVAAKLKLLGDHFGRITTLKGNISSISTALSDARSSVEYLDVNITPLLAELEDLLESDEA